MLFIDAGNTRLKWAVAAAGAKAGDWLASGVLGHAELAQPPAAWRGQAIALVSNVAGDAVWQSLQLALGAAGVAEVRRFRSLPACAGVVNGYRDPAQLGSDRFASLLGARHRYPSQALLVVTCGTATTIDALDAGGRFIGGLILPGLLTMAKSLAMNTAQLPEVSAAGAVPRFADNTHDAIVGGCVGAQASSIADALRSLQASEPDARCLLSGGAAAFIEPSLALRLSAAPGLSPPPPAVEAVAIERIDNLVLLGLHVAALETR